MDKVKLIEQTINKIDTLIKEQLPESKYQFELYDLTTNTNHFRGLDEPFHWGSIYKLFIVVEILKMAEEGLINLNDELILCKEKYKNGYGIVKYFSNLNKLSYTDACKMIFATSDNVCADQLLDIVGFTRISKLFSNANCDNLKLSINLDNVVSFLVKELPKNLSSNYIYSEKFHSDFDKKLKILLVNNYCNCKEIIECFNYAFSRYLNEKYRLKLIEYLMGINVWTKLNEYVQFSKFSLKGKTGRLGIGIVSNETVAIINKSNLEIVGYFSINTKGNKKRYFQSNDTFGLIGLEIAGLYEELEKFK